MNVTKLVSSIDYAFDTDVSLIRVSASEVRLTSDVIWTHVSAKPFPNLIITDKIEAKNKICTVELTFLTCQSIPRHRRIVWKVGLTNGRYMLIGNGNRPYPIHKFTETMPDTPTDNQLLQVKVTYSIAGILPYIR